MGVKQRAPHTAKLGQRFRGLGATPHRSQVVELVGGGGQDCVPIQLAVPGQRQGQLPCRKIDGVTVHSWIPRGARGRGEEHTHTPHTGSNPPTGSPHVMPSKDTGGDSGK
jgi:hypothetical protein